LVRRVVRLYYPTIEITGAERIPAQGPVLFAANHPNSIIDPILVGMTAGRSVHFLAKAPLFRVPIFGQILYAFGMVPVHRASDDPAQLRHNVGSLSTAATYLKEGEAVGIFPEGKSHDLTRVEQVRTGAARIALQAAREGAVGLKLVPLGLNYERKERFRSAVWVQVGKPLEVDQWLPATDAEERTAVRGLTAALDGALKEVVIHLEEETWEAFLQDLEVLYPPPRENRRHPIARLRHRKRLADAMNYFFATFRPRAEALAAELREHCQKVAAAGLTPRAPVLRRRGWALAWRLFSEAMLMNLGFVVVLIGTLHHLLPFLLTRAVARWAQAPGRSTIALARLGIGVPVYSACYALVGRWLATYFLPWVAWVWLVPMPFAGLLALQYWRRVHRTSPQWWREIGLLLRPERLRQLRQSQDALREKLATLAEEFASIRPREPLPTNTFSWRRLAWQIVRWSAVTLVAFWLGTWTLAQFKREKIAELAAPAPALAELSPAELAAMLEADERTLQQVVSALIQLEARVTQLKQEFESGRRDFYRQADDDALHQTMLSYLSCRTTLLGFIWKYQRHAELSDARNRLRASLAQLTSAASLADASLRMVLQFRTSSTAVRKLNEPEPSWGLPPGLFETVKRNLISSRTRRYLSESIKSWQQAQAQFEQQGLTSDEPYRTFQAALRRHSTAQLERALVPLLAEANAIEPFEEAGKVSKSILYGGQSFISTWLGNTRFRRPREGQLMIQPTQLEEFRAKLKPGDILIERQNWFLSRAFMPGFWAHAALYIGTTNDLIRLGLQQDNRVARHWLSVAQRDLAGHEHVVLEAVPEGVRLTTLEHCIGVADNAAVLRPRVTEIQSREAIARAFSHLGKAYDFDFDFFSSDRLVCTELVYRCYDGALKLPLVEVMGRKTLPPTELVRKFASERGRPEAQLDCVCFLDGDERKGQAAFCGDDVLIMTLERPGLIVFPALSQP
jgi:1-acyl-sn-glycerol-3-phosphate acyltransferase